MTRFPLFLMRHGAPDLPGRLLGHLDSPATPAGIESCRMRGAGLTFERLVSSDLSRARCCAASLGAPVIDPRWRELDFGAWDGLSPADVESQALADFWADPDANPPPGGERWSGLMARVEAALGDIPPQPTLVVTHGGPMRAALCSLLGLSLVQAFQFQLPYAALLTFEVQADRPRRAMLTGLLG